MVLGWRRPGRVGRCRIFLNNEERKLSSYKSHARQRRGKLILLSSVGSSERLLTARSLVRVQQGEPQKESKSYDLLFLLSLLPVGNSNHFHLWELVRKLQSNLAKEKGNAVLVYYQTTVYYVLIKPSALFLYPRLPFAVQ